MGALGNLFNAAVGTDASAVTVTNEYDNSCLLSASSTVEEILDWLMLFMCENLDIEEAAFKGGYVLSRIVPEREVRETRDIDFSIFNREYYDVVKKVLVCAAEKLISVGVFSSYELKDTVEPTMSGGIKFVMADGTRHLGVDVGLHDLSYGTHKVVINGSSVIAFTPERMLSDKFSAMFTRKRFRRVKDLYDFYVITNNFDIDMDSLYEMILKRGELDYGLSPVRDEIMDGYSHAYDTLVLNVNSQGTKQPVKKPDFSTVIYRLRVFVNNFQTGKTWDHIRQEMI